VKEFCFSILKQFIDTNDSIENYLLINNLELSLNLSKLLIIGNNLKILIKTIRKTINILIIMQMNFLILFY
jgi:hypothetical protein